MSTQVSILNDYSSLSYEPSQMTPTPQVVNENPAFARIVNARSVLLLQGPVGPMFVRLANWLEKKGIKVHRVVFNGGDVWDSRSLAKNQLTYFDKPSNSWPSTFQDLCFSHSVDVVILFGQHRPCHERIVKDAKKMGLEVVVVEEGYFRPGFATFELGGVNGHSSTLKRFIWQSLTKDTLDLPPDECKFHFLKTCWHASMHYTLLYLQKSRFSEYKHHRETSLMTNFKYWFQSFKVKLQRSSVDHELFESIRNCKKQFFFLPLQHDGDAQITHYSSFKRIDVFIEKVINSFAKHGLSEDVLLIKQHPMSRGGVGHEKFINDLAIKLGIGHRVFCIWESHNPSVLDACKAVVLINSTMGFQALKRGKPVKALGQALFDLPGLASQQTLEEFWINPQVPDTEISHNFLLQLKRLTQVPCSIYGNANEPWRYLNTL